MGDFTKEDRELLIRVDERTKAIDEKIETHLSFHKWVNRVFIVTVFGGVISFFGWLGRQLF